ncbi:hypothetical protein CCP3SC1AL1_4320001 [Gammaproteobacteria bacterium]
MSRQRLRPSLGESSQVVCPRCNGQGVIRGVESLALSILRVLEEDALKEKISRVLIQAPLSVATFLLNEKRQVLSAIELRSGVQVVVMPNPELETPQYLIERLRAEEISEEVGPSYQMTIAVEKPVEPQLVTSSNRPAGEEPAVRLGPPPTPPEESVQEGSVPSTSLVPRVSWIQKVWSMFWPPAQPILAEVPTAVPPVFTISMPAGSPPREIRPTPPRDPRRFGSSNRNGDRRPPREVRPPRPNRFEKPEARPVEPEATRVDRPEGRLLRGESARVEPETDVPVAVTMHVEGVLPPQKVSAPEESFTLLREEVDQTKSEVLLMEEETQDSMAQDVPEAGPSPSVVDRKMIRRGRRGGRRRRRDGEAETISPIDAGEKE